MPSHGAIVSLRTFKSLGLSSAQRSSSSAFLLECCVSPPLAPGSHSNSTIEKTNIKKLYNKKFHKGLQNHYPICCHVDTAWLIVFLWASETFCNWTFIVLTWSVKSIMECTTSWFIHQLALWMTWKLLRQQALAVGVCEMDLFTTIDVCTLSSLTVFSFSIVDFQPILTGLQIMTPTCTSYTTLSWCYHCLRSCQPTILLLWSSYHDPRKNHVVPTELLWLNQ